MLAYTGSNVPGHKVFIILCGKYIVMRSGTKAIAMVLLEGIGDGGRELGFAG